ncbi:MAG TPA: ABC transporter substrate-binding protein [Stellaceae bacterium]|jgi:iron complex transport system substrate-binding protein|nr:ABC transporter substrate-binding protein [Stellaceae bacterium]
MTVLLLVLLAGSGRAAAFVDAAERYVVVPDRIGRVMTANPAADVLVFVLAPEKLMGWSAPLSRGARAFIPAKFARLPITGGAVRPNPAEAVQAVARMRPDLIIEAGPVTPEAAARADQIQQQTGVPYLVLDNGIQATPHTLRIIGALFGAAERGNDLGKYADYAVDALRGELLIAPADVRPIVYYGRGPDGLETGLGGSQAMAAIDQAGVINIAARLGRGELTRVTRDQVIDWNPAIIIAQQRSFYDALLRSTAWRGLIAVASKRVYLAPADPFGWIDDPSGVNRIIGLYWLAGLFYPDQYQEDLRTDVREFYDKFYRIKLTDRQLEALVRPAESRAGESQRQIGVPLLGAEPVPFPNPNAPAPTARPPGRGGLGAPGLPGLPAVPGNP